MRLGCLGVDAIARRSVILTAMNELGRSRRFGCLDVAVDAIRRSAILTAMNELGGRSCRFGCRDADAGAMSRHALHLTPTVQSEA